MTREDILSMESGRFLDALVAEIVMGWTDISRINPAVINSFAANGDHANFGYNPVLYKRVPFPLYSTEISAAWEVAKKLGQKLHFSLVNDVRYNGYYASFETLDGIIYGCDGDDMPEAICKAALLSTFKED